MTETTPETSCGPTGRSDVYRRRRPERTVLHQLVRTHLETDLAQSQETDALGDGVPDFVEVRFRACLRCEILHPKWLELRVSGNTVAAGPDVASGSYTLFV